MTPGPHLSERETKEIPVREKIWGGPWADSASGPKGVPEALFILYFGSSSFSFSVFFILSLLLHFGLNLIQINF
jgi:hypothetical protein